jgi:uncharacterized protein YkwD
MLFVLLPIKFKCRAGAEPMNHQRKKYWVLIVTIATAALLATACGGSSDSPPAPRPPLPAEQELLARVEAQRSTVNPTQASYANPELKAAFDRLNAIRLRAGVGALAQSPLIDKAAQLHSEYQGLNFSTHNQTQGQPGFSGTTVFDRIPAAGYTNWSGASEVIAPIYLLGATRPSPAQAVDMLIGAPLHRNVLLRAQYSDVGIGLAGNIDLNYLTIDLAHTADNIQGAPNNNIVQDHLILWPVNGMIDMPTAMACEDPNPIKENSSGRVCDATKPAGYPASVQVNHTAFRSISKIVQFEMREKITGNLVDTKLLANSWHAADPALAAFMGRPEYRVPDSYYDGDSFVAILPKAPLKRNTEYEVTFVGGVFEGRVYSLTDPAPVTGPYYYPQVRKVWSFTTGDKLDY